MQVYNYDFKGYAFKVGTVGIKIKLNGSLHCINDKIKYMYKYI